MPKCNVLTWIRSRNKFLTMNHMSFCDFCLTLRFRPCCRANIVRPFWMYSDTRCVSTRRLRPHKCKHCSTSFAKGSDLRRHAMALHGVSVEQSLFLCPQCTTEFRQGSQLALHLRIVHEERSNLFECPKNGCDKFYATRQGLKKHLLIKHGKSDNGSKSTVAVGARAG
jgi:uncharacterized Zn-finger protein